MRICKIHGFLWVLLVVFVSPLPANAAGEDNWSLVTFLSARASERFDEERPSRRPLHEAAIGDMVYEYSKSRFRLLAEGSVATDSAQLDRFQVGWELVPNALLWVGKFHEPASAWNFGREHGSYLQTAISTPSIERWSDDAGVLPENVTGALFDLLRAVGAATIQVSVSAGLSPNPVPRDQRTYWMAPVSDGGHQPGWSARVALLPDLSSGNDVGLLAAHHQIDAENVAQAAALRGVSEVDETVYGAYLDGDWHLWRLHAAIYYVDFSLIRPNTESTEDFASGYAQFEHEFCRDFTAYLRHEDSARARQSSYLRVVQYQFAEHTSLIGLRWDFSRHQALTAEVSRVTTFSNQYSRISLQWSAVLR